MSSQHTAIGAASSLGQNERYYIITDEEWYIIQNKLVDNSSQPGPQPKTTTRVRVLQLARFGYRQTEMKHNKFKTNKLITAASQDQSQKPQQEYVFSNLPVSGIQGQANDNEAHRIQNKQVDNSSLDQSRKPQDFKKGFMWGGSDGVDHVTREVLQHGVGNRGSPHYVPPGEFPNLVSSDWNSNGDSVGGSYLLLACIGQPVGTDQIGDVWIGDSEAT